MQKAIPKREEAQGVDNALASAQAKENVGKEWPRTPEERGKQVLKELEGSVDVNESYETVHYWLPPSQPSFAYDEGKDIYVLRWPKPQAFDGCELDRLFEECIYKGGVEEFHYLPTRLLQVDYTWEFHNKKGELTNVVPMGMNLVAVCLQWSIFHGDSIRYSSVFNWSPIVLMREFNGFYVFSTNVDSDVSYKGEDYELKETSFEYMDVLAVKKEVWDGRWTSHVNSVLAEGCPRNQAKEG